MNINKILTYLAVLTLSFNAFAFDVQEKSSIANPEQASSVVKIAMNQESPQDDYLANDIVKNHKIQQTPDEKPGEFLTALSVCLIIIVIYSIYGMKANSKNVRN